MSRFCRCGTALARDNSSRLCSACQATRQRIRPPEFWQTEIMAAALDSGDLGQVLRAYRCHPYHRQRLSQALVAGWLHMSQAAVCRIERGRRRLTIDEIAQIASTLAMPITLPWAPARQGGEDSDPFTDRSLLAAGVGASHFLDDAPAPAIAPAPGRPAGFEQLVEILIHATPCIDAPADLAALTQASASAKRSLQACEYALTVNKLAQLLSTLTAFDGSLDGDDALRLWAVRAHAHQSAGLLLKPAVTERRTSLYIDLARALVQWDRYAEACRMLAAAERLAPEELASRASVLALVAGMVRRAPRSAQPAIRALALRTGAHQ